MAGPRRAPETGSPGTRHELPARNGRRGGRPCVGRGLLRVCYTAVIFEVTGNPDTPDSEMVVIDCVGVEHPQLAPAARVGFGTSPGFNPCLADVPVVPTTWSRIKQRY